MNTQRGLILVELIAVIVLVGIIATFTGFFLYTGFTGYLNAKKTADGAFNAQMAMDRIYLELRNISEIKGTPSNTSITYKNEKLTGTRTLKYENNQVIIRVDPDDYPLLEDVAAFSLSYSYMNLDGDTAAPPTEEVAGINVTLELTDVNRQFTTRVYPRNMIEKTW